jgi:lycopene cyclase domain-containing protein
MTYFALNLAFLVIVAVVAFVAARRQNWAALVLTGAVVLVFTAVFDNIMIAIGLVAYDSAHISGILIGMAPIEDFAYALAAIVGLPSLWVLLERRRRD